MRTICLSVFKKPKAVNELRGLYDTFVLVPAGKASNNIVSVCTKLLLWMSFNDLPLLLEIPLTLEPVLQRMKFFKIIFFFIFSTVQKIKISLKYPTFVGIPKSLQRKIHCWFQ
jgi:hypothetical protein